MNLWLLDTASGAVSQLTDGPGGDFQPRFSPDGKRLAFFSSRSGHADIWALDLTDGRLARLTGGSSADVNPTFVGDGRTIAFMSDRTGRLEVWLMNADGTDERQLTDVGVMGHFLAIPQDGSGVVFRCPSAKPGVLKVPFAGGPPESMSEIAGGAHMSFSPDGSRILDVVGHKVLWVSPLAGGVPEKVFEFDDPNARIDYPNWSPDGRGALFDLFRPQGGNVWMMEEQ
jgi:TolB protein